MRLDNLSAKDKAKYEALAARGLGDVVGVNFYELVVDGEESEIVELERLYYIGSATLGMIGKVVQVASIAFARGATLKSSLGVEHNIPFVESFTQAGVLSDFLGAIMREDDEAWVEENVDFKAATSIISAFLKHNDFFEMLSRVMETVGNLRMPSGEGVSADKARNALLGGLAQKG